MALKQRHNEPDETAATTQRRIETATATKTTGKINKTTGFEIQTNGTRTPLSQRKLPPPPPTPPSILSKRSSKVYSIQPNPSK